MQRSKERRGTQEVALGLCDSRLCHKGIHVVRRSIENLSKLSQRFAETTKNHIGKRVLGEWLNVARVEPLGFVEIRRALVPLAPPPRDNGQRFRNLAAIRQELTCLRKVTYRSVVIL